MSLINDALKKVSEAERGKPAAPQTDFETRAMQPVAYESRSSHLLWISAALFLAAICVAGFVFVKTRTPASPAIAAKAAPASSEVPKTIPTATEPKVVSPEKVIAETSTVQTAKASTVSPNADTTLTNSVTAANATPAPTGQAAPAPAQPEPVAPPAGPVFRLKGILYTKNPTALINEASVQVGGEVDGATVTKIESTSVTLDYQGKTTVLKLAAKK